MLNYKHYSRFNAWVRFGELLPQNSTHISLHFSVLTPCAHIESTNILTVWAQLIHNYPGGNTRSPNLSHTNQTLRWIKGQNQLTVFLSGFDAILRSEMKFSKLLVQAPHHLVTCAHHKNVPILLNKLRLLWFVQTTDYISLWFPTLSVAIVMLLKMYFSSVQYSYPQNLKSLVHRIKSLW